MIQSTNPFNDPEIKKQLLESEGIVEADQIEDSHENVSLDIQEMLKSAPMLPGSAKNIILDSSVIVKNSKDQKSQEFNLALNSIISKYNETYGTDISIDFSSISNSMVSVSDPDKRRVLELYVSEVFKSIKPLLLLHLLNRLVLCIDYVLDPKRMLDQNSLSLPDLFLVIEKLISYANGIQDLINESTISDSDSILKKLADDKNDASINSEENKEMVEEFMKLFKKENNMD